MYDTTWVGIIFRDLRKEAGYTQAQMAKMIGVSQSYYCQIENNVRTPSTELLHEIFDVLCVTNETILKIRDERYPERKDMWRKNYDQLPKK